MKKTSLLCLMIAYLGCPIIFLGQSKPTSQLQLTTDITDAKFCSSDYLRLQLRLRYFNSGDQPVILYRESNTIMTYFISKTISDADAEKHEQKYSPMQSPVSAPEFRDGEAPDEETFVILEPSASYEVTTNAHLPFIFNGKDKDPDLLRPGRHVLQIRVQTWPAAQNVGAKLRDRWRGHGHLWTQSLISRPVEFNIPKHPSVVGCSPN
ncbi:MAG TPA: hypothetical protein VFR78_22995 [Pyrinomonadaceae bacterium]|nr:hypothetical protein [Pyrinomonadaceae bacterium]